MLWYTKTLKKKHWNEANGQAMTGPKPSVYALSGSSFTTKEVLHYQLLCSGSLALARGFG